MARIDSITERGEQQELYSDFLTNLNAHPVSGMLLRNVNEVAITRSIKNIISTNRGERLYQPTVGSDIRKLLFEPLTQMTADLLKEAITSTITIHEPRAKVMSVEVVPVEERNLFLVRLVYMLITKQTPITVDVVLTRVR